jgi:type IV secretory pathway VirB2 component (pilin)
MWTDHFRPAQAFIVWLVAACADLLAAGAAHAAGSGMPWEAPLQRILESVEGPVAKIIAVIIIIVTGLSLAFGDMGGGFRRLLQIFSRYGSGHNAPSQEPDRRSHATSQRRARISTLCRVFTRVHSGHVRIIDVGQNLDVILANAGGDCSPDAMAALLGESLQARASRRDDARQAVTASSVAPMIRF